MPKDTEQAEIAEEVVTEEIETEEVEQGIEEEGDQPEAEAESETDEDEEETVVTIGDEDSPPQEDETAPEWVRELRKTNREQKKRIKELEAKTEERAGAAKVAELGPKPTLEGCDYDEEKFADAVTAWHEQKREIETAKADAEKAEKDAETAWQARLAEYNDRKKSLGVKDYDDAEDAARDLLSQTQQGILVQGMDDPAVVIYALGKNPQKLKEMAAIKDPVKFAVAAAKLETTLKISKRSKPQPEGKVTGSARSSGLDSTLEKLEAEAERTGDRTKVQAHKRRLREAAKT